MGLFGNLGKSKDGQALKTGKATVSKAVKLSDKMEELVSEARWGDSQEAKNKAMAQLANMLGEISSVSLLHAIHEKQPYKEEAVKQLVLQRYFEIINGINDPYALLEYKSQGYSHNFSNNASLRIETLVSQIEDQALLEQIYADSRFDYRAKGMAKLMLTHGSMSQKDLFEIARGNKAVEGSGGMGIVTKAAVYIEDMDLLQELAFNSTNLFDVVITAQLKLIQKTGDVALLEKIKQESTHFRGHQQWEPFIPVLNELADKRIAELKG